MPAYMVARATITDRTTFDEEFQPRIAEIGKMFGAKLLAQSDDVATLIGDDRISHLAILEFPDLETAKACANSAEFRTAMKVADTCIKDHYLRLLDGLPIAAAAAA